MPGSQRMEGKVVKGAATAALRATLQVSLLEESTAKPSMRRATAVALLGTSRPTVRAGQVRAATKVRTELATRGNRLVKLPR